MLSQCCILCTSDQMYILDIRCFINRNDYYYYRVSNCQELTSSVAIPFRLNLQNYI